MKDLNAICDQGARVLHNSISNHLSHYYHVCSLLRHLHARKRLHSALSSASGERNTVVHEHLLGVGLEARDHFGPAASLLSGVDAGLGGGAGPVLSRKSDALADLQSEGLS